MDFDIVPNDREQARRDHTLRQQPFTRKEKPAPVATFKVTNRAARRRAAALARKAS